MARELRFADFEARPFREFAREVGRRIRELPSERLTRANGRPAGDSDEAVERVLRDYVGKGFLSPGTVNAAGKKEYGSIHYLQYIIIRARIAKGQGLSVAAEGTGRDSGLRKLHAEELARVAAEELSSASVNTEERANQFKKLASGGVKGIQKRQLAPPQLDLLSSLPPRRPLDAYDLGKGLTLLVDRTRYRRPNSADLERMLYVFRLIASE